MTPQEQPEHLRLILVVYNNRVVRAGAPEIIAPLRVRKIVVCAGIDQHVRSEGVEGEAECIRMTVGSDGFEPKWPAIKGHGDRLVPIAIAAAQDVVATLCARVGFECRVPLSSFDSLKGVIAFLTHQTQRRFRKTA